MTSSNLPQWLWPAEDEEAVRDAERLIEETHVALQRMEANMQNQPVKQICSKTTRLKSLINSKMYTLEKELKGIAESVQSQHMHPVNQTSKPCAREENNVRHQQIQGSVASKSYQQSHIVNSLGTSVEKVVVTARDSIEDALLVARHVSASLDSKSSQRSLQPRNIKPKSEPNVKIFEVKSKMEPKHLKNQRLEQSKVSSICIQRPLECQQLASIEVLPGVKAKPQNFVVRHFHYQQPDSKEIKTVQVENEAGIGSSSQVGSQAEQPFRSQPIDGSIHTRVEEQVTQLAKHLAQVEELHELNQSQVNNVLKFLVERVCSSSNFPCTQSSRNVNLKQKPSVIHTSRLSSASSSVSGSSKSGIAYDSLSRFLETYRRAAKQPMQSGKKRSDQRKADEPNQQIPLKPHNKTALNHLLIGPLRESVEHSQEIRDEYLRRFQGSPALPLEVETNSVNFSEHSGEDMCEESGQELLEPNDVMYVKKSADGSLESVEKDTDPHNTVFEEQYEDDWEEEEVDNKLSLDAHQLTSPKSIDEEQENSNTILSSTILAHKEFLSQHEESTVMPVLEADSNAPQLSPPCPMNGEASRNTAGEHGNNSPVTISSRNCPRYRSSEGEHVCAPTGTSSSLGWGNDGQLLLIQSRSSHSRQNKTRAYSPLLDEKRKTLRGKDDKPQYSVNGIQSRKTQLTQEPRREKLLLCGSSGSGSDEEITHKETQTHNSQRERDLDLHVRDDLNLRSALFLNLELEERWRNRNEAQTQNAKSTEVLMQQSKVITDIEDRWNKAIAEIDHRLRAMEDEDRIAKIIREIRLQTRAEEIQQNSKDLQGVGKDIDNQWQNRAFNTITTKEHATAKTQTVDIGTECDLQGTILPKDIREMSNTKGQLSYQHGAPPGREKWLLWQDYQNGLTEELLSYGQAGVTLPSFKVSKQPRSNSLSSSTSSHLYDSILMSLSEGEVRGSMTESCSCSDGEVCICREEKKCIKRTPPDGSHAFGLDEHHLRDISIGEVAVPFFAKNLSEGELVLNDNQEETINGANTGELSFESGEVE